MGSHPPNPQAATYSAVVDHYLQPRSESDSLVNRILLSHPYLLPGSTQILIKNTFIQFEDVAAQDTACTAVEGPRPRGDSCDAVLFSSTTPARCKTIDALLCIPENPTTLKGGGTCAGNEEDTTDQDSAVGSASTNAQDRCGKSDTLSYVTESRRGPGPDSGERGCKIDPWEENRGPPITVGQFADVETNRMTDTSIFADVQDIPDSSHTLSPTELLESLAACEPLKRVPLEDLPAPAHDKTTVMLRNIPNKYTQSMLLDAVNQEFRGLYDFFYLPIDFKNKCNVGYAFINFIHPYYAELFSKKFAGLKLTAFKSKKICEVSWGRVQGLRANIEHYRNSAIMSIPNSQYKPLIFKDGIPLQFPGPAGPVPSVKPRHGRPASSQLVV